MSNRDTYCPQCERYIGHVPLSSHRCVIKIVPVSFAETYAAGVRVMEAMRDRNNSPSALSEIAQSDVDRANVPDVQASAVSEPGGSDTRGEISKFGDLVCATERVLILEILDEIRSLMLAEELPPDPEDAGNQSAWFEWFKQIGRNAGHNDALRCVRAMLMEKLDGKS